MQCNNLLFKKKKHPYPKTLNGNLLLFENFKQPLFIVYSGDHFSFSRDIARLDIATYNKQRKKNLFRTLLFTCSILTTE